MGGIQSLVSHLPGTGICPHHVTRIWDVHTDMNSILVIGNSDLTPGLRSQMEKYMRKAQFPMMNVRFTRDMTHKMSVKKTKTIFMADPEKLGEFKANLARAILKYQPRVIIINDWVALEYITGKHRSLDLTRGGVYFVNDIPAVVVDSLRVKGRNGKAGGSKLAMVNHAAWLLLQDLKKVKRWYDGEQHREPRFTHKVVETIAQLDDFRRDAASSLFISMDLETTGNGAAALISCSGYAMLQPDGSVLSWVIPLLNPFADGGRQWQDAELGTVLETMRHVHANAVPKVMQNGSYDTHYYTKYRMPVANWFFDTAVAFHSIWPEIPKRIDFICSVAVDHYRYWKDEGKADEKDDRQLSALPNTPATWDRYLRYCAFDCHYTLLAAVFELKILSQTPWAMSNYQSSFRQIIGPGNAMSLRGVRVNEGLQEAFGMRNQQKSFAALQDLHVMVNDNDFNPNAPQQVASLVYDVLGAKPLPKRGLKMGSRSTNEKDLNIVMTQHPLIDKVIRQVWATKKPANNFSKYGPHRYDTGSKRMKGLGLLHGRWMYKMNPIGTETGRYSSKASDFWIGTQIQNAPYEMRAIIEPDPGYVLFDFDYSKADFWHTAFASGESEMIKVALQPELDVHCFHAAKFFSKPYDDIYAGYKNKEPWVVDSLTGVRQNAKRIVYGANYLMMGMTLFLQMGKEAVDATAIAMGEHTAGWGITNYKQFCQTLLDFYFSDMYPGLLPWIEETVRLASRGGNRVVCAGGRTRTFFSDLMSDKAGQRELVAYYGQGGTAGTLNKVLDSTYYAGLDNQDLMFLFQVHDSIIGQVREDKLHLLVELKKAMEINNHMNGHDFIIPAEGAVGYGWGFRMCDWHPDITKEEMRAADAKWHEKNADLVRLVA